MGEGLAAFHRARSAKADQQVRSWRRRSEPGGRPAEAERDVRGHPGPSFPWGAAKIDKFGRHRGDRPEVDREVNGALPRTHRRTLTVAEGGVPSEQRAAGKAGLQISLNDPRSLTGFLPQKAIDHRSTTTLRDTAHQICTAGRRRTMPPWCAVRATITAWSSLASGQPQFSSDRDPKCYVPVGTTMERSAHPYGSRKRRTGRTTTSRRAKSYQPPNKLVPRPFSGRWIRIKGPPVVQVCPQPGEPPGPGPAPPTLRSGCHSVPKDNGPPLAWRTTRRRIRGAPVLQVRRRPRAGTAALRIAPRFPRSAAAGQRPPATATYDQNGKFRRPKGGGPGSLRDRCRTNWLTRENWDRP